jgi:hypothetical protein
VPTAKKIAGEVYTSGPSVRHPFKMVSLVRLDETLVDRARRQRLALAARNRVKNRATIA